MNRAELAEGRQSTHRNLVFGGSSRDPNHDAVIRIRAKLRAAAHSRNRRSMPWFATRGRKRAQHLHRNSIVTGEVPVPGDAAAAGSDRRVLPCAPAGDDPAGLSADEVE
jgi:hypothetical protein